MALDLATAKEMHDLWIKAEKAILSGQAYSYNGRELTRVNMSYVRKNMAYWERKVKELETSSRTRRGPTMRKAVYADE